MMKSKDIQKLKSSSSYFTPFFSFSKDNSSTFFKPAVQKKCADCGEKESIQRKEKEPEEELQTKPEIQRQEEELEEGA